MPTVWSASARPPLSGMNSRLLQRKCAYGGTPGPSGECENCRKKRLQRKTQSSERGSRDNSVVLPIVHEVLRSSGQPLDAATRAFMEPRFGHEFSQVRVHTGAKADESARAVNALAQRESPQAMWNGPEPRESRDHCHRTASNITTRHWHGFPLMPLERYMTRKAAGGLSASEFSVALPHDEQRYGFEAQNSAREKPALVFSNTHR